MVTILTESEKELMALYVVIKKEMAAIESLRAHADASISRLEALGEAIKDEVTRESIS
jgi:hypothetical protein